ncbi:MAG: hypothetical protein JNM09_21755 [Blastocatellia bacterium]|jgi:hypothetical protein|nr:hypothetical protein [Blastocatellia bacterium]
MNNQTNTAEPIYILAGTSQQYTDARRKLALIPLQAFWLTRASNLTGKVHPKVYRFGDWKSLVKLREIEAAMTAVQAEVIDLT